MSEPVADFLNHAFHTKLDGTCVKNLSQMQKGKIDKFVTNLWRRGVVVITTA